MRFLVDAQLPTALARYLAAGGHEAEHVADIGLGGAKDQAIWEYAARVGAVIVSEDEDFAQRTFFGKGGPLVVWIRLPNWPKRELLLWFEPLLPRSALSKLRESSQEVFGRTGDHKKTWGKAEPSSPIWAARLPPLWRRVLTQSMSMLSMNMAATIMTV